VRRTPAVEPLALHEQVRARTIGSRHRDLLAGEEAGIRREERWSRSRSEVAFDRCCPQRAGRCEERTEAQNQRQADQPAYVSGAPLRAAPVRASAERTVAPGRRWRASLIQSEEWGAAGLPARQRASPRTGRWSDHRGDVSARAAGALASGRNRRSLQRPHRRVPHRARPAFRQRDRDHWNNMSDPDAFAVARPEEQSRLGHGRTG
jgi:hypothetical protein